MTWGFTTTNTDCRSGRFAGLGTAARNRGLAHRPPQPSTDASRRLFPAPADLGETANPARGQRNAFRGQELPFEVWRPAEAANLPARRNHAVARCGRVVARPHDGAHRSRRARPARHGGDIAVGGDPPRGNGANHRHHAAAERRVSAQNATPDTPVVDRRELTEPLTPASRSCATSPGMCHRVSRTTQGWTTAIFGSASSAGQAAQSRRGPSPGAARAPSAHHDTAKHT